MLVSKVDLLSQVKAHVVRCQEDGSGLHDHPLKYLDDMPKANEVWRTARPRPQKALQRPLDSRSQRPFEKVAALGHLAPCLHRPSRAKGAASLGLVDWRCHPSRQKEQNPLTCLGLWKSFRVPTAVQAKRKAFPTFFSPLIVLNYTI